MAMHRQDLTRMPQGVTTDDMHRTCQARLKLTNAYYHSGRMDKKIGICMTATMSTFHPRRTVCSVNSMLSESA